MMQNIRFWFLFTFLIFSLKALGQQPVTGRNCATDAANKILQQNPEVAKEMQRVEEQVAELLKNRRNLKITANGVVIPVVFHVVYNTPIQRILLPQLQSQLDVLNQDFFRENPDTVNTPAPFRPLAGKPKITFCLAVLDENGDPTTGVTYTSTSKTEFDYTTNDVKFRSSGGQDAWNPDLFLNIWVCNLADNVIGYAQFPGGPRNTDGIVLKYSSVGKPPFNASPGPYNQGRTATHEIGHWLGLRHIWGEQEDSCSDSDLISDTPNQARASNGCPTFPRISCNNGPDGDMFMNFMDYSNDACMNMFTKEQVLKMEATLLTRPLLLASNVCSNELNADFRAEPEAIFPGETTDFFYYANGRRPDSFKWTFEGGIPAESSERNPQNIRYEKPGIYTVTLTVTQGTETDTETKQGFIHVTTRDLELYPNPAASEVTIGAPAYQELERISIYNLAGKLVWQQEVVGRSVTVNTAPFGNGLYIVKGSTNANKTLTKKFMINRN